MPAETKASGKGGKRPLRRTIVLDLPGAAERHRERCRRLGLPEDTPWNEIGPRMHRRVWRVRRRRANLRVGLWGAADRAVLAAALLSATAFLLCLGGC